MEVASTKTVTVPMHHVPLHPSCRMTVSWWRTIVMTTPDFVMLIELNYGYLMMVLLCHMVTQDNNDGASCIAWQFAAHVQIHK